MKIAKPLPRNRNAQHDRNTYIFKRKMVMIIKWLCFFFALCRSLFARQNVVWCTFVCVAVALSRGDAVHVAYHQFILKFHTPIYIVMEFIKRTLRINAKSNRKNAPKPTPTTNNSDNLLKGVFSRSVPEKCVHAFVAHISQQRIYFFPLPLSFDRKQFVTLFFSSIFQRGFFSLPLRS